MSTQADLSEQQIDGKIKWYDLQKGFGFVAPDDGGKDIMFHAETIQQGRYLPQPNDRVRCGFRMTAKGRRANWLARI